MLPKKLKPQNLISYTTLVSNVVITTLLASTNLLADTSNNFQLLDEYIIANELIDPNNKFGGISGIDRLNDHQFIMITDGRNTKDDSEAKFYQINLLVADNKIKSIETTAVSSLYNNNDEIYPEKTIDSESIRFSPDKTRILTTSELGNHLNQYSLEGKYLKSLDEFIPEYFNTGYDEKMDDIGLRKGLGFEGMTISPSGKYLFIAAESSLKQDGPVSSTIHSSPARVLKYSITPAGDIMSLEGVYLYNIDPIQQISNYGVSDNGISEILAVSDDKLIVIERSGRNHSEGFKEWDFSINAYLADLKKSTNIQKNRSISEIEANYLQPIEKKLLIDFSDFTQSPDNIEGVTFGPEIDGKKSLIFITDDNFSTYQHSKIYLFADTLGLLK